MNAFGFGRRSGITCPGETAGSLSPFKSWSAIDAGAISFGQGISVSAIQLIAAASAIANDGLLMKPMLVREITDRNGETVKRFSPEPVRRAVSSHTAATVRRILKTVITEGGTGVNAALKGYSVCGKTGTAQKIDSSGTYAKGRYLSSFLGLVPADQPELAILVLSGRADGSVLRRHRGGTRLPSDRTGNVELSQYPAETRCGSTAGIPWKQG